MPWRKKGITPMRMPIGKDGLTYDPGLVVETQRLPADGLLMSDIWLSARLTKAGREVIPTDARRRGKCGSLTSISRARCSSSSGTTLLVGSSPRSRIE